MSLFILSVLLLSGALTAQPSLVQVQAEDHSIPIPGWAGVGPIALMEGSVIAEASDAAIDRLRNSGVGVTVLLSPLELKQAKLGQSLYLLTPPEGNKRAEDRLVLQAHGRVLAEDANSYLLITSERVAEAGWSARYELADVKLEPVHLPAVSDRGPAPPQPGLPLGRNAIIDSIIARITATELAQLIRELSGEVRVIIRGVSDSLYSRYATSPKNSDAIQYCYERLDSYAGIDSVKFHGFTWQTTRHDSNVIATKLGRVFPGRYLIIGGHIDSRATLPETSLVCAPGADDNGSGCIAMMIAAKYLAPIPFKKTIRFIAWNAEEFGLYGSYAHATEARARNDTILGVLNADMVASDTSNNDSIRCYTGSRASSRALGDTFFQVNADYGIGLRVRRDASMPASSDHYYYYTNGYDVIDASEDDFCPFYHTTRDRITAASFDTVYYAKAVKALVATLATLAEPDTVVRDIGVTGIVAPTGKLDSGSAVVPQAEVRNYGMATETFSVTLGIGAGYLETRSKTLGPGVSDTAGFPSWIAGPRGASAVRCSVFVAGDVNRANDTLSGVVNVAVHDVGVVAINAPAGAIPRGSVTPEATVRNHGTERDAAKVFFRISATPEYADSVVLGDGLPFTDTVLAFRAWEAKSGTYAARCSTEMAADQNRANDTLGNTFTVLSPPPGWKEVASMPDAPSQRQVKDGGWLAVDGGSGVIYAAKGNKTPDFYCYFPKGDSWHGLESMPMGREEKNPHKGSVGTVDGGRYVYATKGNNSLGFFRYDIEADSWEQRSDVPPGASRKRVKGGTDLVYAAQEPERIYLLKGYGTEFYSYFPGGDSWRGLDDAPDGGRPRWDKGSFLVHDPDRTIYAHKAKQHELHAYDTETGSWKSDQLKGMPVVNGQGRRKKSKDGGSGAWLRGSVYALKGGNTQEFWRYDPGADSWEELDTMPSLGSTLRRKKVKAGGDIVALEDELYALKGNKTNELWCYVLPAPGAPRIGPVARQGVMSGAGLQVPSVPRIAPNPAAGDWSVLDWGQASVGLVEIRIHDVLGRLAGSQSAMAGRSGKVTIDLRGLSPGVYLVQALPAELPPGTRNRSKATVHKLVVER